MCNIPLTPYWSLIVVQFNLTTFLYQLGEFGCVYKGIWTQTTVDKEKTSEVVAVKTIKNTYALYTVADPDNFLGEEHQPSVL